MIIPKLIFQTSRSKDPVLIQHYQLKYPEYKYVFFDDNDAIKYFDNHQLPQFSNISSKFLNLRGAHRADLLRYFWLYINGGIYMDTDIELIEDPCVILGDNSYVGVITNPNAAFNGFIACRPYHPIIFKALNHIYNTNEKSIPSYGYFCQHLSKIMNESNDAQCVLYEKFMPRQQTHIIDKNNKLYMIHYYRGKDRAKKNLVRNSDTAFENILNDVFKNT